MLHLLLLLLRLGEAFVTLSRQVVVAHRSPAAQKHEVQVQNAVIAHMIPRVLPAKRLSTKRARPSTLGNKSSMNAKWL